MPAWLAMKLKTPEKVRKIQLVFRKDEPGNYLWQGKNVQVQIGFSPLYSAKDLVCTKIDQLKDSSYGLVDYDCDQIHEGQYVILSNDQPRLTICEAKVFVEPSKLLYHSTCSDAEVTERVLA